MPQTCILYVRPELGTELGAGKSSEIQAMHSRPIDISEETREVHGKALLNENVLQDIGEELKWIRDDKTKLYLPGLRGT